MDKEKVVEKLRLVIKELVGTKGEFSLVMLIPTEPNVIDSKLTLIISAPWLDKMSPKQALELMVKYLKKHLNEKELSYIIRVTTVNSSDNFIKAINSAFSVKESAFDITNSNIHGVQIDKAILLESHRVTDSKERFSVSPAATE